MITVVLHNGMCNRLLPLISSIRLAEKHNKKVNIIWTYTPVRSCIAYHGELCKFNDLFIKPDNVVLDAIQNDNQIVYEFRFWENKDHVVDEITNQNIFINYALYTIISEQDDKKSIFKNLKSVIVQPQELILDNIGIELGNILKYKLLPIPELQKEIESTFSYFNENMIGIHIRRSDGGFSKYNWKEIIKILVKQCKEWCLKENNGVFLATDDMNTYIEFVSVLGNKLIFYNPPDILCNTKSTSGNKFSNDKYNTLTAVVELYLLGKCNRYIIGTADSTYSVCAMLMSNEETKKYLINDVINIPKFLI